MAPPALCQRALSVALEKNAAVGSARQLLFSSAWKEHGKDSILTFALDQEGRVVEVKV